MLKAKFKTDTSLYTKKMGLLKTQLVPFAKVTTRQLADVAYAMIKQKTGKTKSGATDLASLWIVDHNKKASIETFTIRNTYPNQDIILFREVGTVPHVIQPTEHEFLRFFIGGREIFARYVAHPGTKAHLMVLQTSKFMQKKMNWWEQQMFKQAAKIQKRSK